MPATVPRVKGGYEASVSQAQRAVVSGWDFSWLRGRSEGPTPSWSYLDQARGLVRSGGRVLDLDTGDGELLASLKPLPPGSAATEGWATNVPLARRLLEPLGVRVLEAPGTRLPVPDGMAGVVLCRHGRLPLLDVARVLRPGGVLLTQQVGSADAAELNAALGAATAQPVDVWTAAAAATAASAAGLEILDVREERPPLDFFAIGAVEFHLRMVAWQVPDFDPVRYDAALRRLHEHIERHGRYRVLGHRFLLRARRPPEPANGR